MTLEDLAFPVLALRDDVLFIVRSKSDLARSTVRRLNQGHFDDLQIVDSHGFSTFVTRVEKRGGVTFLDWLFRREFAVDLSFGKVRTLSFNEVKVLVADTLQRDPSWRPYSRRARAVEAVHNSDSLEAAFRVLQPLFGPDSR